MTAAMIDNNGWASPIYGLGTVQTKAYTGTAGVIDDAVGADTKAVRIWCSTAAHIAIGASPTATTSDTPVTAEHPEVFKVRGGIDKVSAIQQSSGGTLYVTELT